MILAAIRSVMIAPPVPLIELFMFVLLPFAKDQRNRHATPVGEELLDNSHISEPACSTRVRWQGQTFK